MNSETVLQRGLVGGVGGLDSTYDSVWTSTGAARTIAGGVDEAADAGAAAAAPATAGAGGDAGCAWPTTTTKTTVTTTNGYYD